MATRRTLEIIDIFKNMYSEEVRCYLTHSDAWELLVATILSAQCTDARVNIITKDLFAKYRTIEDFANADLAELEQDIKQAGFYHNKAKNIIGSARMILSDYDGEVPSDIEDLTRLPGVGRKTANVIRGNIYGIDSIVVDTHVKRISGRLQLTKEEDPEKIEYDLMKVIPREYWILINIWFITFGRTICKAQSPKCQECPLVKYCRDRAVKKSRPRKA
ncbi:MAG: endonuclease III [Lachnospiraceae bacterium]|jgi:endonuclease-3|nr:endonuclease III [Lachnospiraceae bacterium]MBQ8667443.1 endonuclease III [Lachnospiraceae bacterium]